VEVNGVLILVDFVEIELKRIFLVAKNVEPEAALFLS
jgi:hypothetical protein